MTRYKKLMGLIIITATATQSLFTQPPAIDTALENKAADWVSSLRLNDEAKSQRIKTAIAMHLSAVKDWHNSHPYTLIPEGINPTTGGKLSEMDRQLIVCSAKPKSIHDNLMNVLKSELDTAQVEVILDKYTIGKVAFTLQGYKSIVPDLTAKDEAKSQRIKTAIAMHLTAVKDWHNSHPYTLIPEGINPTTGGKLSEMDRQLIVCSAKPKSIHDNLMNVLKSELDTAQVEVILDKYTIGKVAFTLQGYKSIVPDLTAKEEAEILKNLKQAREQAIDYKNMKEISAIFEIYKTKCEQYLNNNGRNWRQLYKAYVDKVNAEKKAKNNN